RLAPAGRAARSTTTAACWAGRRRAHGLPPAAARSPRPARVRRVRRSRARLARPAGRTRRPRGPGREPLRLWRPCGHASVPLPPHGRDCHDMENDRNMLAKGLQVLQYLVEHPEHESGVSDVARALGLPVSTAHRLLGTLLATDWVSRAPHSSSYRLGPQVLNAAE